MDKHNIKTFLMIMSSLSFRLIRFVLTLIFWFAAAVLGTAIAVEMLYMAGGM